MPGVVANKPEDEAVVIKPKMLKKMNYFKHLQGALDEYDTAFIVNADNVGSKQMQEIRIACREDWYDNSISSFIDPHTIRHV